MTTYDVVWAKFVNTVPSTEGSSVPQDDESIYKLINEGVDFYNSFEDLEPLSCNDEMEEIDATLDTDRLSILANCLRYIYLESQLMIFESVISPMSSDVGIKNYREQRAFRQDRIDRTRSEIDRLIGKVAPSEYLQG